MKQFLFPIYYIEKQIVKLQLMLLLTANNLNCKTSILGQDYTGTYSQTVSGRTCQRWDSQTPHEHINNDPARFPDASLDEVANYCRNPDNDEGGPWCYTTDPDIRYEYCAIEFCDQGKFCC